MNGGADGIGFILRDIADDLKEIEEELWAEKKSANSKDEPSKV
jgi:hypothetical protein